MIPVLDVTYKNSELFRPERGLAVTFAPRYWHQAIPVIGISTAGSRVSAGALPGAQTPESSKTEKQVCLWSHFLWGHAGRVVGNEPLRKIW